MKVLFIYPHTSVFGDIRVTTYNMIGFPFETRDMAFDTIELNRKVKAAMSGVWPFKPFPKTRLTSLANEYGVTKKDADYCSIESEICTPHLKEKDINGLVSTFSFYVKVPRRLFPLLEKCKKDEAIAKQIFTIFSEIFKINLKLNNACI